MMYQQQAMNPGYAMPNQFYPYGGGAIPNQNMPTAHTKSWLTPDQISKIKKRIAQFDLSVSDDAILRGNCNHYNTDGTPAIYPDKDGSGGYTCAICGTHFNMRDFSPEDVKNSVENVLDILNTIKVMYLSVDPTAATDYFQIIPFIEKIPKLYEVATNDFSRYDNADEFTRSGNQNSFNLFYAMNNPGSFGYGYGYNMPQQAPYGMPPQQPMGQPMNPGFNPMYGAQQPQAPYGMPQQGYQPQTQGFAMNPQGAAAPQQTQVYPGGYQQAPAQQTQQTAPQSVANNMPVQPQAPAATENVTVDTQFKK